MDVFLVFNELSARDIHLNDPQSRLHAPKRMEQFVGVIDSARKAGVKALRRGDSFSELPLANGYTIGDWLHDPRTDRDMRRRLQSAATSYDNLPDAEADASQKGLGYDFSVDGRAAVGLGYAYLLESIAVSLDCDQPHWRIPEICIDCAELDEATDDIVEREEVIQHAAEAAHLAAHQAWLDKRHLAAVTNGADLLAKAADWFPNLVFVEAARAQIAAMSAGTAQLRQSVSKLLELERYCQRWTGGPFDKNALSFKASPESSAVATNPRLRAMREFKLPNGAPAYFEWHLRLTPGAWRLHFLPEPGTRKIYVGYIGPHLETGKF